MKVSKKDVQLAIDELVRDGRLVAVEGIDPLVGQATAPLLSKGICTEAQLTSV